MRAWLSIAPSFLAAVACSGGDGDPRPGRDAGAAVDAGTDGGPTTTPDGGGEDPPDGGGDAGVPGDAGAERDGGTVPTECGRLCGAAPPSAAGLGLAQPAPPGCDGGGRDFALLWTGRVGTNANKSVPLVADVNGDGDPDLLLNPRLEESARYHPGRGDGTFGAAVELPSLGAFAGGWGIDAGDVDGDGDVDVATGDHVLGGVAWLNDGSGGFTRADEGLPAWLASGGNLADLDGDGDLDLVMGADQFSYGFQAYAFADGRWTGGIGGLPGEGPVTTDRDVSDVGWILFGDVNGDGDVDVVATGLEDFGEHRAEVYVGDGEGGFTREETAAGADLGILGNPHQSQLGDVDCDGDLDLLMGGTVLRYDAGFSVEARLSSSRVGQLADMDGDGDLDVVTHDTTGGLRLFLNDGTGTAFVEERRGLPDAAHAPDVAGTVTRPLDSAYGIDLADVDGDGSNEVIRIRKAETSTGDVTVVEVWGR